MASKVDPLLSTQLALKDFFQQALAPSADPERNVAEIVSLTYDCSSHYLPQLKLKDSPNAPSSLPAW